MKWSLLLLLAALIACALALTKRAPGPACVGRLLGINLQHPLLVAPVTLVGLAEGNPVPVRRPRARRADTGAAEDRELPLAGAVAVDEQFQRVAGRK
jgi:hypothetical protein